MGGAPTPKWDPIRHIGVPAGRGHFPGRFGSFRLLHGQLEDVDLRPQCPGPRDGLDRISMVYVNVPLFEEGSGKMSRVESTKPQIPLLVMPFRQFL